jgi:hypothetical protein
MHVLTSAYVFTYMDVCCYTVQLAQPCCHTCERLPHTCATQVWSFRGDELVRMLGALGELHWQLSAETMAAFTAATK